MLSLNLIVLCLFLFFASNSSQILVADRVKNLKLRNVLDEPIELNYNSINFTDLSSRRAQIKAILISPCYKTANTETRGSCGLKAGEPATLDIRFTLKSKMMAKNGSKHRNMGNPTLSQCAIVQDVGISFLSGKCINFPLGKYSQPCQNYNLSKLNCPVLPDSNGTLQHRMIAQVVLPGFTPEVSLNSVWTLKAKRRRAFIKWDMPLEVLK